MLLQILDDGRATDGQGRTVNFKNTIVILTSNTGADAVIEAEADPNPNPDPSPNPSPNPNPNLSPSPDPNPDLNL